MTVVVNLVLPIAVRIVYTPGAIAVNTPALEMEPVDAFALTML